MAGVHDAVEGGVQRAAIVGLVEDSHRAVAVIGAVAAGSEDTGALHGIEGGEVVGVSGLEPETSALSGQCSNQLS